ncbi:hypothetical protein HPP92_028139 [Vanilla planifolia]|uniref:Uncharacterized protein n=1 Tax=Vanilla planifolia TaxID=51239 RepID=A0A835U3X5_VANPL|nr:hypothetical protein HPP92_028139 [Vanilla planifolia]KAG0447893.1 hypothetical protein HPP92_028118 [Vanilla planifolia]
MGRRGREGGEREGEKEPQLAILNVILRLNHITHPVGGTPTTGNRDSYEERSSFFSGTSGNGEIHRQAAVLQRRNALGQSGRGLWMPTPGRADEVEKGKGGRK